LTYVLVAVFLFVVIYVRIFLADRD